VKQSLQKVTNTPLCTRCHRKAWWNHRQQQEI